MEIKERIFSIAKMIADTEDFEIVFNEEPESAHFLKRNSERFGRDLELYNFMSKVMGVEAFIATFLEEIVLPSKVDQAIEAVKNWGLEVYPSDMHQAWCEIFTPNQPV